MQQNAVVNFTGRRRLTQDEFKVELDWNGSHPKLALSSNEPVHVAEAVVTDWRDEFPVDSRVRLEFFKRSAFFTAELGTIGDIRIPTDSEKLVLKGFSRIENVNYRVLIYPPVGPTQSRLLGRSATLSIPSPNKTPKGSNPEDLCPIISGELDRGVPTILRFPETAGDRVHIVVSDDNQELLEALRGVRDEESGDVLVPQNPAYYALTMVPYLQEIATRMVSEYRLDPDLDLEDYNLWVARWNWCFGDSHAAASLSELDVDDDEAVKEWIEEIVSIWCKRHSNPNRDIKTLAGGV